MAITSIHIRTYTLTYVLTGTYLQVRTYRYVLGQYIKLLEEEEQEAGNWKFGNHV